MLSPFKEGSIRTRLIALVGVVAVPLIGVIVWMSFSDYGDAKRANSLEALSLAEAAGAGTSQFLADVARQLGDLSAAFGRELRDPGRCPASVESGRALLSFAFDVAVFSDEGELLCTTETIPEGASRDVADAPWFLQVLSSDTFTVGRPQRGPYSGRWVIPFVVPIHDQRGTLVGALGVSVDVDRFQSLLSGVTHDREALITVTDAESVVIARSLEPARFVGDTLPSYPSPGEEIRQDHWLSVGEDMYGIERTWGRVDIPALGWAFYAGLPMNRVRTPALAKASKQAAMLGGVLLLSLVVGLVIQRGIAGSLAQLRRSVREAAVGGAVTIPEGSPVEVREVAEQLNRTLVARDEAQVRARAAQARFLSLLENAVVGIFISAGDERFLHVNPALVDMLGYESAEDLQRLGPGDLFASADARHRFEEDMSETQVFRRVETEWLRQDGSHITVELTGRIVPDPAGERIHEVHVQDVTAQRRFERELLQTQKMEAVGRLAGGVAHDFNNLLTVISGNLMLALGERALPPALRDELDDAQIAADRAAALTRKLLAFSRKDRPEPRVVDANELVRGIQTLLSRLIPERIEVKTALEAWGVGVVADPGQLEQVVMNLVLNARDAIDRTGTIEVSTSVRHDTPPAVARTGPLGWFMLRVRDTGVGMASDVQGRIFEPFFTTKRSGEGTGLGLSTVHAVVTQAGGHLTMESAVGVGTTFDVWLPAVALADGDAGSGGAIEGLYAHGETILVIEDEDTVRETVQRILERVGYEVITARNGREGLVMAETDARRVDLVLCDVVMPVLGGIEVSRILGGIAPDLPVVLMSGYSTRLPVSRMDRGGVRYFLDKPFTPLPLLQRIRGILDARGTPVAIDDAADPQGELLA